MAAVWWPVRVPAWKPSSCEPLLSRAPLGESHGGVSAWCLGGPTLGLSVGHSVGGDAGVRDLVLGVLRSSSTVFPASHRARLRNVAQVVGARRFLPGQDEIFLPMQTARRVASPLAIVPRSRSVAISRASSKSFHPAGSLPRMAHAADSRGTTSAIMNKGYVLRHAIRARTCENAVAPHDS